MYIQKWLNSVTGHGYSFYVKYLAANDTLATGAHQAGPYVPKAVVFDLFPTLERGNDPNPRAQFEVHIDSHQTSATPTAIWYNQTRYIFSSQHTGSLHSILIGNNFGTALDIRYDMIWCGKITNLILSVLEHVNDSSK